MRALSGAMAAALGLYVALQGLELSNEAIFVGSLTTASILGLGLLVCSILHPR
jgi:hypothetical protein